VVGYAYEEREETMRTHYENPLTHRAFTALETLSADDRTRILARKREESLMNERYESVVSGPWSVANN